jgi:hypothetical protein
VPFTLGLISALVVAEVADDEEVLAPIVGALLGLTAFGVGVALVETGRD